MKKKTVFIVSGALLVAIILCGCLYVGIRSNHIKNEMWDYLKANNYEETEIKSVDVKHSVMNVFLSYNEWTIDVVFEDEQTSVYKYTVKEGSIVQNGVSGTTNKEDLKHLDVDKLIYGNIEQTEKPDVYPTLDIISGEALDEPRELVENINVKYLGAGQIKKWSISSDLIDDVMEWYEDLEYMKVSFEEGESPADGEGQTVYELQFLDGTTLEYYYCGQESYIRMDGIWYKIKNPNLPPVGEPAF